MVRHGGWREAAGIHLIGVASARWTLDAVKARMRDSLAAHAGGVDEAVYSDLSERLRCVGGDYRDAGLYERLHEQLADARRRCQVERARLTEGGWKRVLVPLAPSHGCTPPSVTSRQTV
jgi:glucose-6-phosphate 1-dehydrogenase